MSSEVERIACTNPPNNATPFMMVIVEFSVCASLVVK